MSFGELGTTPGKIDHWEERTLYQWPTHRFQSVYKSDGNHRYESAEIDSKDNLQSLMLLDAAIKIVCRGTEVTISALSNNGGALLPHISTHFARHNRVLHQSDNQITLVFPVSNENFDEDARLKAPSVFDVPRYFMDELDAIRPHKHAIFLAGAFAYDLIASFEVLSAVEDGINTCPDYVFYLSETFCSSTTKIKRLNCSAVFERWKCCSKLLWYSSKTGINWTRDHAVKRGKPMIKQCHWRQRIQASLPTSMTLTWGNRYSNQREHSRWWHLPSRAISMLYSWLSKSYGRLQTFESTQSSPYMFYLKDANFEMFGASPESALKYDRTSNQVEVYPIAGTRIRGKHSNGVINTDLDSRIELELREDTKEKSEHLMLVDLARNDIAKVSVPGTRSVKDLLKVDRYSTSCI